MTKPIRLRTDMARIQGFANHKKRGGMLTITEDTFPPMMIWRCADPSAPTNLVELELNTVSHLKATPATSDKLMLKIGLENGKELLFGFNSRKVMDDVKVSIQQIIARKKTSIEMEKAKESSMEDFNNDISGTASIASDGTGASSAGKLISGGTKTAKDFSEAGAEATNAKFMEDMLDTKELLKNLKLQQKFLRENLKVMKTFKEAVINEGMEAEDFWKSRIHLLRAYAIQNNQKKGPYNVLSTIKPVASSDNEVNVNVTREKINEIFKQYPIVLKAFDDNVPRMSEGEFWSRFFSSKLFRKLRGEKVNLYDRGDVTLDKYLYFDPDYDGEEEIEEVETVEALLADDKADISKKRKEGAEKIIKRKKVKFFNENTGPIPKVLDIEGNREDDPQLRGNKPDITMKDDQDPQLVGILRTMNRLSRRLIADIEGQKSELKEQEFSKELELIDLDEAKHNEYNELKYTQTSNVASNIVPKHLIEKVIHQSNLNPESCEYDDIMIELKNTFQTEFDLTTVYRNMKKEGKRQNDAYKDINNLVKQNAKLSQQSWNINLKELLGLPSSSASTNATNNTLSRDTSDYDLGVNISLDTAKIESVKLTHTAAMEFLKLFWTQFNKTAESTPATDPNFKSDLIKLRKYYFSIRRCLERVDSQINNSEDEKEKEIKKQLLAPLIQSLKSALNRYEVSIVKPK